MRFPKPVSKPAGLDELQLAEIYTDTTNSTSIDFDCPMCRDGHVLQIGKPLVGIGLGVRVGKSFAEIAPDIPVVRIIKQRFPISLSPVSNKALLAFYLHSVAAPFTR